ncbi:MAG: hypothetical protein ACI8XV_002851, partial [Arenicella sp.]
FHFFEWWLFANALFYKILYLRIARLFLCENCDIIQIELV